MKPINVVVYGVAGFLVFAGIAVILGSIMQNESLVFLGKIFFLVAFVASCIPLLAVSAIATWNKVDDWLIRVVKRRHREDRDRKSTDQPPIN